MLSKPDLFCLSDQFMLGESQEKILRRFYKNKN